MIRVRSIERTRPTLGNRLEVTTWAEGHAARFLDTPPGLLDLRLIWLGGVFMLMTLAVFAAYAYASATVRDLVLGAPVVLRWFQRSLGTLLIALAAKLAVSDR